MGMENVNEYFVFILCFNTPRNIRLEWVFTYILMLDNNKNGKRNKLTIILIHIL